MTKRILHVPYTFWPNPVGGTEIYVQQLIDELKIAGIEGAVAAADENDRDYNWKGIPVFRYSGGPLTLDNIYGQGDRLAAANFAKILRRYDPNIVHFHSYTSAAGWHCIKEVKLLNIPAMFTYHTPTVSCPKGDLMSAGGGICDGSIDPRRCSKCILHETIGGWSNLVTLMPDVIPNLVKKLDLSGGIWTAVRLKQLLIQREIYLKRFLGEMSMVVAPSLWVKPVLMGLGISAEKIKIVRQGVSVRKQTGPSKSKKGNSQVRLIYMGRIHSTKGLDVVIKAITKLKEIDLIFDIYGDLTECDPTYRSALAKLAGADERIVFKGMVSRADLLSRLDSYDALLVPSRCLETGPLVVLEAFAAGIPVVGSNLGGISERITHNVDGILAGSANVDDWARAIHLLANSDKLRDKLKEGIRTPKTSTDVAHEMMSIYRQMMRPLPT